MNSSVYIESIVAVFGGVISSYAASLLKIFLVNHKGGTSLQLKSGRTEVKLSLASDLNTLKEKIVALQRVSPRLAILYGWELLSKIISRPCRMA